MDGRTKHVFELGPASRRFAVFQTSIYLVPLVALAAGAIASGAPAALVVVAVMLVPWIVPLRRTWFAYTRDRWRATLTFTPDRMRFDSPAVLAEPWEIGADDLASVTWTSPSNAAWTAHLRDVAPSTWVSRRVALRWSGDGALTLTFTSPRRARARWRYALIATELPRRGNGVVVQQGDLVTELAVPYRGDRLEMKRALEEWGLTFAPP